MGVKKRRRVEPTEQLRWGQLELLLDWPEQVEYEKIRDVVVFGSPVAERAAHTGNPERTFYRRVESRRPQHGGADPSGASQGSENLPGNETSHR